MNGVVEHGDTTAAAEDPGESRLRVGTVAVVGLGYAGLPAAVAFGRRWPTIGYDASPARVEALMRRVDATGAVSAHAFAQARHLWITQDPSQLARAEFVLVAVPTAVAAQQPDLTALEAATRTVGRHMRPGAVVIYTSRVYPGAVERVCVPLLEQTSGRRWRRGFHVGYSPARAGADELGWAAAPCVVAADDAATLERVAALFGAVVPAGVRRVSTIGAAEAAGLVHSVQRDLNIALVNELALVCERLGFDTGEVLRAAEAPCGFVRFRPGLPGGHALGTAPYYLAHAARRAGWQPELIAAGRRINDRMAAHVAAQTARLLAQSGRGLERARVNVLGLAYKEDCTDVRHSQVTALVRELHGLGVRCFVHDPLVDPGDARDRCGVQLHGWEALPRADALIVAVAHRRFVDLPAPVCLQKIARRGCLIDVKGALDPEPFRRAGIAVWRL
jgi:UDP-N-acetyl-D-galactosamine dehydrogenase